MNFINLFKAAMFTGFALMLSSEATFANEPFNGEVILSEIQASGTVDEEWCHLPTTTGWHMLNRLKGCYTDDYDLVMLKNLDSALTITIMDHGWCSDHKDNWSFTFKTIKQPTDTAPTGGAQLSDWVKFETIWNTKDGEVVVPGIMKVKNEGTKPDFTNQASCVIIERE